MPALQRSRHHRRAGGVPACPSSRPLLVSFLCSLSVVSVHSFLFLCTYLKPVLSCLLFGCFLACFSDNFYLFSFGFVCFDFACLLALVFLYKFLVSLDDFVVINIGFLLFPFPFPFLLFVFLSLIFIFFFFLSFFFFFSLSLSFSFILFSFIYFFLFIFFLVRRQVNFTLGGSLAGASSLAVWMSNSTHHFLRLPDLAVTADAFSIFVPRDHIFTLTTTSGQSKGALPQPPDYQPFPFPFAANTTYLKQKEEEDEQGWMKTPNG